MIAPSAMAASWIQDTSIQETSSRAIALVTAVAPTAVSAVVQNDPTGRSPLTEGQNLTLPVGAATQVISGNVIMTGTTSMVQPGLRVIILGIYSRVSNSFQSITRLRVLHAFVMPTSHLVTGRIVSAPVNDRSPTTFTVMDTSVGLVIISVGATTPVYRHYGAKTQIDELSTGDLLRVEGSFLTGSLFAATAITDWSIQKPEDRFYGKIISMNGNTVTARKLADPQDNLNVIPVGAVITLKVSATTAILVPAPSPAVGVVAGTVAQLGVNRVIGVYGIYDRAHRTYTVVAKLRMYR